MRSSTYEGLFYTLAKSHELIRHQDDSPRFARIIVSVDPLQRQVDLHELQTVLLGRYLKPGAGQQVLVLESLQTVYRDNKGDNYQRQRRGAFFILEKVSDPKTAWETLDRTEQTGEQLLAAVLHKFREDPRVRWEVGSINADAVGPLGEASNWYGTRFDFEFFTPATAALQFNPAVFTLPI
ncbi:MAG: hypothetical protein ACRYFZ_24440 [Janthinobacterium lividum]